MDDVGRLLLRFLLVPLGGLIALMVAIAVVVAANWGAVQTLAAADPERQGDFFIALVTAAPELMMMLAATATYALAVAAVGVLIAEVFAVRSCIFHAANGGLAAGIGWSLAATEGGMRALSTPISLVAAGLAAGLAYWLVAGSTSGFFKPRRAPRPVDSSGTAPR
ncbi:hypothetical protein PQJ75_29990 [Rhodoplanes sp. TEM]|uniref:Uncharacterized protein n=1 Tax=Rhodoplanes tepidamans TaxID=200616 RepID=A0ABT5JDY0_RHOTP|nr:MULTISPECIES: hypothetical protein [Rhodoplanes]MDC7787891.1 hypothetical protein [Rhodoplanes tepidamans]MDC7987985.1 hypothetical protein [Rhodoplanes sp. TEM]MDQ0353734.1 phage-related tail protein [Rhodoplanes tepidamans]